MLQPVSYMSSPSEVIIISETWPAGPQRVPEHRTRKVTPVEIALNYLPAPYISSVSSGKGKNIRLFTSHSGCKDELN